MRSSKSDAAEKPASGRVKTRSHSLILGVPVDAINMRTLVAQILSWCRNREARVIFVRDTHGVMRSVDDPAFRKLHHEADLVIPDGAPLAWISKLNGFGDQVERVPGADVVDAVCAATQGLEIGHFFFGGKPGVAEEMADRLKAKYPGLRVAGTYTPGFGDQPPDEIAREIEIIRSAEPHIVWVGFGTPKQEIWMMTHAQKIGAVLLGVGAAFDFHSGMVERAPRWMRENGLEWLHRLISEPRRLWYRYLVLAPRFAIGVAMELLFRPHESRAFTVSSRDDQ